MELYERDGQIYRLHLSEAEAGELYKALHKTMSASVGRSALLMVKGVMIDPIGEHQASFDKSNMYADRLTWATGVAIALRHGQQVFEGAQAAELYEAYLQNRQAQARKHHRRDPQALQQTLAAIEADVTHHETGYAVRHNSDASELERLITAVDIGADMIVTAYPDLTAASHDLFTAMRTLARAGLPDVAAQINEASSHLRAGRIAVDVGLAYLGEYRRDIAG
jgi:hypothetical protein